MSVINVVVQKDKGVVAVDTFSSVPGAGGELRGMSRVLLLPHGQMLLACRSHQDFFFTIYCELLKVSNAPRFDIDSAEGIVPRLLDVHWRTYTQCSEANADASPAATQQFDLVAMGWSEKSGSVIARVFSKVNGAPTRSTKAEGSMASPGHPLQKWKGSTDEDEMVRAARVQVHYRNLMAGATVAGGDLLLASISREGVSMKKMQAL